MTEEVPTGTDLEFLLLNTWKIDASKVQAVIEKFLKGGDHKTLFCFTETKVDSLDFLLFVICYLSLAPGTGAWPSWRTANQTLVIPFTIALVCLFL